MMLNLCGGLLVVVVFNKPLAFFSAKMRVVISYVSPRYSQHIVGLWKKEIQRVSKNKSNSLSGRKGFFHNNAGNRLGFQILFQGDKQIFLAGSQKNNNNNTYLVLSFRCFQNIHSAAFTDKNLPLFSLDRYLADHLPRIQKEDQWDTVSYFFKEMLRQRDELKRLEDMEREVMAAVQRCLDLFRTLNIFYSC